VRQYTEDREITAWLVLDLSASMRFGAAGRGKDAVLTDLAVCLARLFTQGGNRVGAILYDHGFQRVVPARAGRTHVLQLTHEIARASGDERRPDGSTTDLAAMLRLAATTVRRRSLVFVISDFMSDADWEDGLKRLAHRHEVVAIRVADPMEADLPDLGLVLVEDAETGEQVLVDSSDPLFRQRLRAEVERREAAVSAAMGRAGVSAHLVSTDDDLVQALIGMIRRAAGRRS
jgi:uncharacterized protein (DUF58 family)